MRLIIHPEQVEHTIVVLMYKPSCCICSQLWSPFCREYSL